MTREERKKEAELRAYLIAEKKKEAEIQKRAKLFRKQSLAILKFMLKTDVLYYHHGRSESMKELIRKNIETIKKSEIAFKYHPYYWNYSPTGSSYMPLIFLDCIWSSEYFEHMTEVPLDGSYVFEIYDSGQRGLGSFNRISCKKVEVPTKVPHVDPGAFPQKTLF